MIPYQGEAKLTPQQAGDYPFTLLSGAEIENHWKWGLLGDVYV